ncbi:uncharacterized protein BXZ73DRAFT_106578 [Epithele typhae]|uniref:uncharacterized protein n=1 Tax=Epithele typhae TaxID=378194 RepID=UPI002007E937|nr:uncharacterized protein BXZ73DRAFT_106578 [Epithele typhae]KAH9914505.1 hypothetical protein BXZ73DRAFT_106578 [Epithele typhae]
MQPLRRADGPRRPLFLHPDNYCQKVLDAKIETFEAKNYFTAMYNLCEVDPTRPRARKGLLKGELILKALYGNPTAAIRGDAGGFLTRKQPGQKSVAEKTNVDADSFTLYSVVATAALVRFYVTKAQLGYEAEVLTSTDLYYLRELFGNGHEKCAVRPPTTAGDQMLEESDNEAETCDIDEPFGDASGGKD